MGLLDSLQLNFGSPFGGARGGLLDFLRPQSPVIQQDVAQGQQAPQATPPSFLGGQQEAGLGDRLGAAAANFAGAGGLIPALFGGISGLATGQRTDPAGVAQQNMRAQYEALLPTLGPQKAMLAIMNPEAGKILIGQALQQKQYGFATLPDGTVVSQDPQTGKVAPAYQGGTRPKFGVVAKTADGRELYGFIDEGRKNVTPYTSEETSLPDSVVGPDGKPIAIPPGVDRKTFVNEVSRANAKAAAGEKTEVQAKSEKFGNKMELAERNLRDIEKEGAKATERAIERAPLLGGSAAANMLHSESYQKYKQARDNFITALLRDESGAAIGSQEFNRYERELFPQPGDTNEVIAQKRDARRVAIDAMKKAAGPGYKSPEYQAEAKTPTRDEIEAELRRRGKIK